MTSSAIEALYIYSAQTREPILEHTYRSRPPPARSILPLYLSQPTPRPSVLYCATLSPPSTLFTTTYANLIFIVPSSHDVDPLAVLTFLSRITDILEDFLGAPLVASKISNSYDVVAQLLHEVCDAGTIANTEASPLKDAVEVPGWLDSLLSGINLSGGVPGISGSSSSSTSLQSSASTLGRPQLFQNPSTPALPWRRANVRHTSNELYVDVVETLQVTLAPSGRLLAAFVHGSILFTAKISGVPDLLLTLGLPGGNKKALAHALEALVFHPCVRLRSWRDEPGVLSFVPPDGRFMLAGYEVDLLPKSEEGGLTGRDRTARDLNLPVTVEVNKSLGSIGLEFEVRLTISNTFAAKGGNGAAAAQLRALSRPGGGTGGSGRSTPSLFGNRDSGTSNAPALQEVTATIPVPAGVRNISEMRASRGEATFQPGDHIVEWRISAKEASGGGVATLRCTVIGAFDEDEDEGSDATTGMKYAKPAMGSYEYDENEDGAYQGASEKKEKSIPTQRTLEERDARKVQQNRVYMPSSATVSFSVKGWLASGLKVDSLVIDTRKSKGLGEGVKPVKGVKYLTVSKRGIETRC